jgi:hypothetical protein
MGTLIEAQVSFSDDILDYLRVRRGTLVCMMDMIDDLTRRINDRSESRRLRGRLLSDLSLLTRQKKVIRYRRVSMVKRLPRSAQGLLRISELHA